MAKRNSKQPIESRPSTVAHFPVKMEHSPHAFRATVSLDAFARKAISKLSRKQLSATIATDIELLKLNR